MPAPFIAGWDGTQAGQTGRTVDGVGFGPFADEGRLVIAQNNDPNNLGTVDELTYTGGHDQQLTGVSIPASLNNVAGTVYLFYQRLDSAWSEGHEFTLSAAPRHIRPATMLRAGTVVVAGSGTVA